MSEIVTLRLDQIRTDGGTQVREALDEKALDDYEALEQAGGELPPVAVFQDADGHRWLSDGFHRYEMGRRRGGETIRAAVREGTRRDALLYTLEVNRQHGVRLTRADRRKAVLLLLADAEWRGWSDREIARRVGVDGKTVATLRAEVSAEIPQMQERTVTRGGTTFPMDTSKIGMGGEPEMAAAVPAKTPAPPTPAEPDPSPRIEELDFTTRTYNCLKKGNIQTIADLVQTTEEALMKIRNFAGKSLLEVRAKLAERGLTLAGPPLPDPIPDGEDEDEEEAVTRQLQAARTRRDEAGAQRRQEAEMIRQHFTEISVSGLLEEWARALPEGDPPEWEWGEKGRAFLARHGVAEVGVPAPGFADDAAVLAFLLTWFPREKVLLVAKAVAKD